MPGEEPRSDHLPALILHPSSFILGFVPPSAMPRWAALLWAALPPLGLWPLAWIAPAWWVLLVRGQALPPLASSPPKRRRPVLLLIAWAVWFAFCTAAAAVGNEWKFEGFWVAELVIWPAAAGLLAASARRWRGPALLHAVAGGIGLLAGGAPLAAAAALGHLLRLAGDVVLFRLLFARVRLARSGGRPSFAGAGDRGGAGGLDGAGIGPRPPAHRHDHGEPGPHANTAGSS